MTEFDAPLAGVYSSANPASRSSCTAAISSSLEAVRVKGRVWMTLDGDLDIRWEVDLARHVTLDQRLLRLRRTRSRRRGRPSLGN